MLEVKRSVQFRKAFKNMKKRGYDIKLFLEVVKMLAKEEKLPAKYKDHALKGEFLGFRECHITPDWLLIYEIDKSNLILYLFRTGSHSDLDFG